MQALQLKTKAEEKEKHFSSPTLSAVETNSIMTTKFNQYIYPTRV